MPEIMVKNNLNHWALCVKIRAHWTCEECGELDRRLLDAHHIKSKAKFPALALDITNGKCLCLQCHSGQHSGWAKLAILARLAVKRMNRKVA